MRHCGAIVLCWRRRQCADARRRTSAVSRRRRQRRRRRQLADDRADRADADRRGAARAGHGPDYQAELAAIKSAQARLTPDAAQAPIDYWSKGGVAALERDPARPGRSRQPAAGAAGRRHLSRCRTPTTRLPIRSFPFGNPPYAARAYSYVAVAQVEALKAAWYYKYLYNRPAPSKVDSGIKALMPTTDLPAYPSEDAVLSGVTAELLKLLFPASVEEITLKAAEQRQAALLSGKATASDIAAGLALGQAVAAGVRRARRRGRHGDRRRLACAVAGAGRRARRRAARFRGRAWTSRLARRCCRRSARSGPG